MRNNWKNVERRIAKRFGTVRTPLSGSNSGITKSDTLHKFIFNEIKHGNSSYMINAIWKKWEKDAIIMVNSSEYNDSELVIIHIDNILFRQAKKAIIIKRKKPAITELFIQTMYRARLENKIPIVCLHKKGKQGFLVVVKPSDISKIKNYLELASKGKDFTLKME